MVGHLHLQSMDDSLKGKNREGLLDSPDSGLPPSPSPPFCSLSPSLSESRAASCATPVDREHGVYRRDGSREGKLLPYLLLNSAGSSESKTRMHPVFFGESIEVKPKPEQEIKCNSEVKYDSDRHFRDQVHCAPFPTPISYSETVVAVRDCTWRSYKSEVHLEPRQKPVSYRSTTIIYPKHAKSTYRTTLRYNSGRSRRWFVSTVQLESSEDTGPCVIYAEDL